MLSGGSRAQWPRDCAGYRTWKTDQVQRKPACPIDEIVGERRSHGVEEAREMDAIQRCGSVHSFLAISKLVGGIERYLFDV